MSESGAIQDSIPNNHCFGCGPDNPLGLHIKSYRSDDVTICTYQPRPEQSAGPRQFVYGGTIASIIDCHSVGTAIANYYALEDRAIGSKPEIWCVTGRLDVSYKKPTPIDQPVVLTARIVDCSDAKTTVECTATSRDTVTAEATVIAVRVPDSWRSNS